MDHPQPPRKLPRASRACWVQLIVFITLVIGTGAAVVAEVTDRKIDRAELKILVAQVRSCAAEAAMLVRQRRDDRLTASFCKTQFDLETDSASSTGNKLDRGIADGHEVERPLAEARDAARLLMRTLASVVPDGLSAEQVEHIEQHLAAVTAQADAIARILD